MTKYEKLIYDLVNCSLEHMTAEQILHEVKRKYPAVSRATIYNNLNKLCNIGMIHKLTLEASPDKYDRVTKHDHIICQKCGQITDINFDDLTTSIKQKFGDDCLYYDLKIFYICPNCKNKKND